MKPTGVELTPELTIKLLRSVVGSRGSGKPRRAQRDRDVKPTVRQLEVLQLLIEPGTIEEIALRHHNKWGTLRKHVDNLRNKTGCRTREALVAWGIEHGYIDVETLLKNT